jgi:hypothetical protein
MRLSRLHLTSRLKSRCFPLGLSISSGNSWFTSDENQIQVKRAEDGRKTSHMNTASCDFIGIDNIEFWGSRAQPEWGLTV